MSLMNLKKGASAYFWKGVNMPTANKPKEKEREPIDLSTLDIKNKPKDGTPVIAGQTRTSTAPVPSFEPPAEMVALPSRGHAYAGVTKDEDILSGHIKVRPMTLTEEKILATNRLIKTGQALDMVYSNCIKSDINPLDLLSSDRLFIMFYLRGISYGHDYTFTIRCPNITCTKKFKYTVDISKQEIKEIEHELEYPLQVTLPRSGATIYYRLPTGRVEKEVRNLQESRQKAVDDVDDSATDRLKLLIERIVDPNGDDLEKNQWLMFLNSLIGGDAAILRDEMTYNDANIEPIKNINCPYCGEEFDEDIPITVDFFRVSGHGSE